MDFIGKIDSSKDLVNKEYVDGLWTSDKIVSTLASKSIALGKLNGGTTAGFLKTTSAGVVSAATLSASDIPSITKSKISDFPTTWAWDSISGKPTKLSDFTDDVVSGHYLPTSSFTAANIVSTLGTTAVAKATDADTVDGIHYTTQNDIGYTHYKTVTLATTSVWYVSMACTRNYASELQWIAVNPGYDNNMAEMRICLYDYRGKWRALTSEYNNCNVLGMQTSLVNNPTLYFKMRAPSSSGTIRVYAPFNFTLTASTTAPSGITFDDIIQGAYIGYERLRINGISPIANNTNSLGTASLRWSSVYTYGLFAAGNANIDGTLSVTGDMSVTGTLTQSNLMTVTRNGNTTTIGSRNANYCHIYNSADVPFIFNNAIMPSVPKDIGSPTYPWSNVYANRCYLGSSGANYIMSCNSAFSAGADLSITGYSNSQIPTLTLKATTINMLNTTSVQMASADVSIGGTLTVTGKITGKTSDADHADAATNSDTVDGFHVATMPGISNTLSNNTMLAMRAQTINLSDTSVYSTSNYYPITFPVSRACGFVDVRLSYISSPYQYIDFLVRGASYYGVTNKVIVREITRWSGGWYIGCIGAGSNTNALCCIWLKGGYSYRVISNSTFTAHSANYTNGSCTYTVGTNPYGGTNTNVTVMFTPGAGAGEEGIGPSTQASAAYMSGSIRINGGIYTNSNITAQGDIRAIGELTGFYSSSDIRLKKDLTTLSLDGDKIASLPLYSYKRTDRNNKQTDGTIAQEVQKLLPNEVYDRGDGYLAMAEGQLGLIFGINAHKEIKRLSERVKKLERLIEDMDNGMERLAEMN